MRTLSGWILRLLITPLGIVVLGALDSTVFVSLPGGLDAAIVLLAARRTGTMWRVLVPLLATAGSMAGAALTYWMGAKIGEDGLERYIPNKRLEQIRRKVRKPGAIGFAVLDLIPPPFPFTPFILAAGALEVARTRFFITLTVCRIIRFGGETVLASIYGPSIVTWLESDLSHGIVIGYLLLAVALTALSIVKFARPARRTDHRSAAA